MKMPSFGETAKVMVGAVGAGVLDGALEAVLNTDYYSRPSLGGVEPLPPDYSWAVLSVSAVPYLVGHFAKNEGVKTLGEGMLLYSAPMMVHHTIVRAAKTLAVAPSYLQIRPKYTPAKPAMPARLGRYLVTA